MTEEKILNEIDKHREDYITFLRELITTESYNPPGNEKNVALKIEKYLKDTGISCEIFPFGDNRANLIAFLNDNFKGKNLLYNAHMDVVPPGIEEEWKYPPLSAFIKSKKYMYGRGTVDMKAALAAMVISLTILKKIGIKTSRNLIVNAVADEEMGGTLGTGWCLENILKPRSIKCDFVLIGEPSGLSPLPKTIIFGEKGHLLIKVITNGKSAHSMVPFMGENAIYMMSKIIENLDKLDEFVPKVDPPLSLEELKKLVKKVFPNEEIFNRIYNDQPLLRNIMKSLTVFTKSVNMIEGGIKENVIPDHCEAIIDFRLLPGQTAGMILEGLKKLIDHIGFEVQDVSSDVPKEVFVSLEIYHDGPSSIWKEYHKSEMVKKLKEVVEKVYNRESFFFIAPGATDAHFYRNSGYCEKTIHFGPGSANQMHAINENIEIQDYIDAIKIYTLFGYNYLKYK